MNNVVIIGAGQIGRAIAYVLKKKKILVELWDNNPTCLPKQRSLEKIVPEATIIFLCVPSQAVRPAVQAILPWLKKETKIICLSKGVELKTKKFMSEVLVEILPAKQAFALCGGPMLAEELRLDKPGVSVLATKDLKVFQKVSELFSGSLIRWELTSDVTGVAWSGVLKNVYAMALGIADGLGWGNNAQAWFLSQSLTEMEKITVMMGGKTATVCYTAGLGDLVATGFSPYSKNRETGRVIAQTQKCCVGGEGAISFPAVWSRLGKEAKKFPILFMLYKILIKNQNAQALFQKYFHQD